MAKSTTIATPEKPGPIAWVKDFYHDVKAEMNKVAWPSLEDVKSSTSVVLFVLAMTGLMVFVFDGVFQFVVLQLLRLG